MASFVIIIVSVDQVVTLLSTIVSDHKNGVTLLLTPNCQCGADVSDKERYIPETNYPKCHLTIRVECMVRATTSIELWSEFPVAWLINLAQCSCIDYSRPYIIQGLLVPIMETSNIQS